MVNDRIIIVLKKNEETYCYEAEHFVKGSLEEINETDCKVLFNKDDKFDNTCFPIYRKPE